MPDPNDPLAAFYAAHPELAPGGSGGVFGARMAAPAGTPPAAPKAPAGPPAPPPLPAGFVPSPTPGRGISHDGFTAVQLDPKTNEWQTVVGYAPSAAEKAAAGISKAVTGGGGTYPTSTDRRAGAQAQQGFGSTLPANAIQVAATRAISPDHLTVFTKDITGNWINTGFPPNQNDKMAAAQQALQQSRGGQAPTALNAYGPSTRGTPTNPANGPSTPTAPGANPSVIDPLIPSLGAHNGVGIPGMDAFRQGIGIPSDGRQQLTDYNGLNTIYGGRQGSMTQVPVTPGFRGEGQVGNSISFASGATGGGRAEPQMLFAPATASVPGTYVQGQGNVNDANRAYAVPFNIGPSGAALANIGGNNVQINAADRSSGTGFALNAAPASNVFAAAHREGSNDPALQAIQAMQLQAAIGQYGMGAVTATNPNQFGGFHAGTGNNIYSGNGGQGQGTFFAGYNPESAIMGQDYGSSDYGGGYGPDGGQRGFAKGGSVTALDPFGGMRHYAGGGSMTTTEPIVGVGVYSGRPQFIVGEDGTGDGRPDAERLTGLNTNQLQITPLHHTAAFAGGGTVQAQGPTPFTNEWYLQQIRDQEAKSKEQRPVDWGGVYSLTPQLAGPGAFAQQQPPAPPPQIRIDPGGINMPQTFATGGNVTIDPMQQPRAATPPPAQDTAAPPASTPPVTASSPPPSFDPLDPAVLAPWQKAQQQLDYQQHLRNTIDNPRRQAGGLGASTGVSVYQGDTPAANLGAGSFYDQRPQVSNVIGQITGNTSALNALGPSEDITPLVGQISDIGINLDRQQRIRDLGVSRVAAAAQDQVAKQQAVGKLSYLQADLTAAQNALANAQYGAAYQSDPQAAAQMIYDLTAKVTGIQGDITATNNLINNPGANVQAIDAEIASLQNALPEGFNQAAAETQRTLLNTRVSNQTKREQLTQGQYNLSRMGVPNLSAPLIPLNPLAHAPPAATPAFAKGGKVTVKKPRSRSVKLPSGKKLTLEEAD